MDQAMARDDCVNPEPSAWFSDDGAVSSTWAVDRTLELPAS